MPSVRERLEAYKAARAVQGRALVQPTVVRSAARQTRKGAAVPLSNEFLRIDALPRRRWEHDYDTADVTDVLTRQLAKTTNVRLHTIQAIALLEIVEHKGLVGGLSTGCHALNQLVLRSDGRPVLVQDIKVGDALLGPDGGPRYVTELHRGRDEMYTIFPVKGEPFTVNAGHLLTFTKTTSQQFAFLPTGGLFEIAVSELLELPRTLIHLLKLVRTGYELPAQPQPLDPHFMGVILGDGSLSVKNNLAVTKPDPEIAALCAKQAKAVGGSITTYYKTDTNPQYRFVGCRPILNALSELGLLPIACENRFIPDCYLYASRMQRLQLIAGLLDTDGHCYNDSCYDWISKSLRLAEQFTLLCRSVGLAAYLTECQKSCQNDFTGTYFRVSVSGDTSNIPCRIPRKRAKPREQKKNPLRTGFTVEPQGVGDYYGFAVTGDGRYLLGDTTITHNSGKTLLSVTTSTLLADVYGPQRPVLFVPAKLRAKTNHDIQTLSTDWRVDETLQIRSYEDLSTASQCEWLERYQPTVCILDEAHRLRNTNTARGIRFYRYLSENPQVIVVNLTASFLRKELSDLQDLCNAALREHCPVPRDAKNMDDWVRCLNPKPRNRLRPLLPGALNKWRQPDESVNAAVGRRFAETPGVILTHTAQAIAASLTLESYLVDFPECEESMAMLKGSDPRKPNDWPLDGDNDGAERWLTEQTLALGFYQYYDPAPPEEWFEARRQWNAFVRAVIEQRQRGYESPGQVERACASAESPPDVWREWREIDNRVEYTRRCAWFSDKQLERAATWLEKHKGLCWTQFVEFGNRLSKLTGAPYYRQDACDADGNSITHAKAGPVIASVAGLGEGHNLQDRWHANLYVAPLSNGAAIEQGISRTHRYGQTVDVTVECWISSYVNWRNLDTAIRTETDVVSEFLRTPRKLVIADKILAPEPAHAGQWRWRAATMAYDSDA